MKFSRHTAFHFCHVLFLHVLFYYRSLMKLRTFWPSCSQTQPLNFLVHLSFGSSLQHMAEQQVMELRYSGSARVLRFPNQVFFCCFNESFLFFFFFSFFQLKHFSLYLNLFRFQSHLKGTTTGDKTISYVSEIHEESAGEMDFKIIVLQSKLSRLCLMT